MTYPKTKTDIVKLILEQTRDDPDFPWKDFAPDKLVFEWFVTGRAGTGLRLTDSGSAAFNKAKISHYDFDFTVPQTQVNSIKSQSGLAKFTLQIDRKINCPYYVGSKLDTSINKKSLYIRIYDHKIAMMMTLYGDFQSYLDSVK